MEAVALLILEGLVIGSRHIFMFMYVLLLCARSGIAVWIGHHY
jgi:hypothetical protein